MRTDTTPCYRCEDGKEKCHGICEKYKQFKAMLANQPNDGFVFNNDRLSRIMKQEKRRHAMGRYI